MDSSTPFGPVTLPLVFALLFTACSFQQDLPLPETLEQIRAIDPVAGNPTDLQHISAAASDSEGNIYIADAEALTVYVYDADGALLRTLGRGGDAPGSFRNISTLHVDEEDRLLVADSRSERITVFNPDGSLASTHESPVGGVSHIADVPGGGYLLTSYHDDYLVHHVDANLETVRASLVRPGEVSHTYNQLEKLWMQYEPGRALWLAHDAILYVPHLYTGEVFLYERSSGSTWELRKKGRGRAYPGEPVTFEERDRAGRMDAPISTHDEEFSVHLHSVSNSLFQRRDGSVVVSSLREEEGAMNWVVELFDASLTFGGSLTADTLARAQAFTVQPLWFNSERGELLLADHRSDPRLRVMELVNPKAP